MTNKKDDILGLNDIKFFVDEFYKKVAYDNSLAPIFISRNSGDWQPHLDRMYLFWNAALFGQQGYKGNPFSKHISLNIGPAHFAKWLSLFYETIDSHFEGELANDAKNRAAIMANTFMRRLEEIAITGIKPIM